PPRGYPPAASWYRKAADQGSAKAQTELGLIYYNGNGVPQDYRAAAHLIRNAADQGNDLAQGWLAVCIQKVGASSRTMSSRTCRTLWQPRRRTLWIFSHACAFVNGPS